MTALADAIDKLRRYGPVRDRRYEHEPRTVTVTDDEAVAILGALSTLEALMTDHAIPVVTADGAEVARIDVSETAAVLRESDLAGFVDAQLAASQSWEFNWPDDTPIPDALGQSLGRASLCWDPLPTGVFQSSEAMAILEELLDFLQRKSVGIET